MLAPLERQGLPETIAAIQQAKRIVLACHVNPDGDTLGSMLSLGLALERLGKDVTRLSSDGIPEILTFLPEVEKVQILTNRRDFDLAIVVDAGELSRTGNSREAVESAPLLIDIDHHVTAGVFGQIRLLDAKAAATGELIYDLLNVLGVEIDLPIATLLMTALLTDTGSFRFPNTTPRTMRVAAELREVGASPNDIAEQVFENKSFAAQKILGCALDSLKCSPDGRIVWASVTQEDFIAFGAIDADTEGIVNAVRSVRGADVAIFLREAPDGRLRVSLRAKEGFDVSQVAAVFGGGGHRLASGCTLDGPLADAEARLLEEVQKRLPSE